MLKAIFIGTGLFFACLFPAAAQKLQLSVEGGAQQSWIPDYTHKYTPAPCPPSAGYCSITYSPDVDYSYKEKPGCYLRGLLTYKVNERVQFYHNLSLSLLRFQPEVKVNNGSSLYDGTAVEEGSMGGVSEGRPRYYYYSQPYYAGCKDTEGNSVPCEYSEPAVFSDDRIGKTSLLYLGQELGVSYSLLPRLRLQAGVDMSYRLYSRVYVLEYKGSGSLFGEGSYSIEKDKSGQGFNGVALGIHTGLAYDLSNQLALSLGMQHSLTPVYEANSAAGQKARSNMLRLGVQYKLKGW